MWKERNAKDFTRTILCIKQANYYRGNNNKLVIQYHRTMYGDNTIYMITFPRYSAPTILRVYEDLKRYKRGLGPRFSAYLKFPAI